jgi:hypothetical protein
MASQDQDPSSSASTEGNDKEIEASIVHEPLGNDGTEKIDPQDTSVQEEKKSFKFKVTIFMLCLVSVVVSMDSVIVAATLPAIIVALKSGSLEGFWVGTSYLLAQTVRTPSLLLPFLRILQVGPELI